MRSLLLIGVLLILLAFSFVEPVLHNAPERLKAGGVAVVVEPWHNDKERFKAGGVTLRFEARDGEKVSRPAGTR